MAFSLSGVLNRLLRPGSSLLGQQLAVSEVQIRSYAARRGTRERKLKLKRALKMKKVAEMERLQKVRETTVVSSVRKTEDLNLPPPPDDRNVYIISQFKPKEYSLSDAIKILGHDLHPTVLNEPKAKIRAFIEINMEGEKKTKTVRPWKGVLYYPYIFKTGSYKRILALCKESNVQKCLEAGASGAAGPVVMKQIKKGEFDVANYDLVIGEMEVVDNILSLRSKLKGLLPKEANGTLVKNCESVIERYKYAIDYKCNLSRDEPNFGWVEIFVGTLDMGIGEIDGNFRTLLQDILSHKPKREGDFITHAYLKAPPSQENVKLDLEQFAELLTANPPKYEKLGVEKEDVPEKNVSAAGA